MKQPKAADKWSILGQELLLPIRDIVGRPVQRDAKMKQHEHTRHAYLTQPEFRDAVDTEATQIGADTMPDDLTGIPRMKLLNVRSHAARDVLLYGVAFYQHALQMLVDPFWTYADRIRRFVLDGVVFGTPEVFDQDITPIRNRAGPSVEVIGQNEGGKNLLWVKRTREHLPKLIKQSIPPYPYVIRPANELKAGDIIFLSKGEGAEVCEVDLEGGIIRTVHGKDNLWFGSPTTGIQCPVPKDYMSSLTQRQFEEAEETK